MEHIMMPGGALTDTSHTYIYTLHIIALYCLTLCLLSNVWAHGDAGTLKGIYA